ncbi:MAG: DNA polymerase subunit beta, partial [Fervidicoccaceae archaeon]
VDIAVLNMTPSYIIEIALDRFGLKQFERKIVQATPMSTPKGYITLDPEGLIVVSFPLARLQSREVEFYKFGGSISLEELQEGKRVLGVNKRLELIKPIEHGYLVSSILGREGEVASLLGISLETVLERMRVLSRRDKIGRTGVYLSELVSTGESFEQKLKEIAERDPAVRRALRGR